MFGKPVKEYLELQKWWLVALAVMGVLRIALSLAGLPDSTVKWFSTNVIGWAASGFAEMQGGAQQKGRS